MQEKRKHVRTAFSANVRLMHASVGMLDVEMRDLSDGGVFLFAGDRIDLPVGEKVEIQALDVEDAPVLFAQIVRQEPAGIALMFIEV
ncbi:MAG: hypothetical protein BMS9Abin06_0881 [Gammaproteobacteria bacterium]|nr:MAG: hypothetical protein BMS9Abin06_0881 [Gammaproteobacteria bacterium]